MRSPVPAPTVAPPGAARAPARVAPAAVREAAPLLVQVPLWAWWALRDGGYAPAVWLPGLCWLLAAAALLHAVLPRPPLRGPRRVAAGALVALACWSGLSLLWAADAGSAWIGAERTLLLALAFLLPALWPPSWRAVAAALVALVAVALGAGALAVAEAARDPARLVDGRLADPTGYPNATAALMLAAALPALALAAAPRRTPWRGAALAGAGTALLGIAALTQSRGGAAVAAAGALAVVAAARSRLRGAAVVAVAGGALAAMLPTLLDVRRAWLAGDAADAVERAGLALALGTGGAALATAAALALLGRVRVPAPRPAVSARTGLLAAGALAVLIVAVALAAGGGSWARERIDSFTSADYDELERSDTRFTGDLGSNRSDYWRVALETGLERPLLGTGEDNFAAAYLRERETAKAPRYAHGAAFEALATLGAPGLLLLCAFAGALAAGLVAAARRAPPPARAAAGAAALPVLAVAVHGAADWSPAFPVVAAPALVLAGAALGAGRAPEADGAVAAGRRPGTAAAAAGALVALVLALTTLPVLVSAKLTDRAWANQATRPAAALADLRRAREIDPLSARPALTEGIVALRLGRAERARAAFAEAARRDGSAWFARYALGLLAARAGDRDGAVAHLRAAAERNPRELLVRGALRRAETGRPMDPLRWVEEALALPG